MEKIYNLPFADFLMFTKKVSVRCIFHFTGSIKPWKNHAPNVFPIKLWRLLYVEKFGEEYSLQRVSMNSFKKFIIWIKFLAKF